MKRFTSKDIKLKKRSRTSHKGQNGVVLVIGGSELYTGAPAFVGMSALATMRTGADLVYVAAPERVAWVIAEISPDLITVKLKGKHLSKANVAECLKFAKKTDVVTLGNGIGQKKETQAFVSEFLKKNTKPVIIDADALRMIKVQSVKNAVLTPHGGELKTLLENSKLTIRDMQKHLGTNILVQKGHPETKIISKNKTAYTRTGDPGMTHGGTGDVLAGIIAGLIAQGNDPFMSACTAAYINGKAAESLAKTYGTGYLASDLITQIPKELKKFIKLRHI